MKNGTSRAMKASIIFHRYFLMRDEPGWLRSLGISYMDRILSWHIQMAQVLIHKLTEAFATLRQVSLTLALLNQYRHCLWKQCRSWSDGFFRNHLIRIYTVCHSVCEFIWTNNMSYLTGWQSAMDVANFI